MVMNFLKSSKFALLLIVVSVLVLTILFSATDPQSARLMGVLVAIVALYGVFWGVILLVGGLVARRNSNKKVVNREQPRTSGSQRVEIAAVLALAPVLIIVLNSLGAIGAVELALVVGFECVVIFLIRKKK
jgi:heme/copper-type cytochrome/quinol oxidase subunit 2